MRIPGLGNVNFARNKPPVGEELAQARIGAALSSIWSTFQPFSDDLTGSKGLGVYQKMKTDAQVQAALNQVYGMVLGEGWEVKTPDCEEAEQEEAQKQADFIKYCFERSQGSFTDNLLDMLDAIAVGWSVMEIVWQLESGAPWDGYYSLKALKSKDPNSLELNADQFGNVTALRQPQGLGRQQVDMPPEKFVIFTNRSPYGNPFGQSDLRAAHKAWWMKDWTQRFYAVFMQRCASPFPVASYKPGTPEKIQKEMLIILDKIQSETGMVIPSDWALTWSQIAAGSHQVFVDCINLCNQEIAKAILSQTLTSGEGQRVGSMALGEVHLQVLQTQLRVQRERLCETVNDQLIRRLIDANFDTRYYPELVIIQPERESTESYFNSLFKAGNIGLDIFGPEDIGQLRDRLGLTATPPPDQLAIPPELPAIGQAATGQMGVVDANAPPQSV
jgi:phage gp29-like protein